MDLSYAQHLEDYHLSCAFGDQSDGFYIDVGAGHPVADNASCWFYLRGWRGIVVEPQQDLLSLYEHVRPRDVREACVLGARRGVANFHAVDRLHGFSTIVTEFAEKASAFGASYKTLQTPMETLASLCARHDAGSIDFLKIDVEGAEREVLEGGDFTRWRPRVIVCEALAPGAMEENWQGWEPQLLAQGYAFAMFDGLNRWYVANEATDVMARFPREKAEWTVAPHLGHTNRPPFREDHPDHPFARQLVGAMFARLPQLERDNWLQLVLHDEAADLTAPPDEATRARVIARIFPGAPYLQASAGLERIEAATLKEFYLKIVDSDAFRVLTGRLSMSWDGGQILD